MTPQEIVAELKANFGDKIASLQAGQTELAKDFARLQLSDSGPVATGDLKQAEYQRYARAFFSNLLNRPATDADVDLSALKAYGHAFGAWLRRGPAISGDFKASMSVGSDPDGGFWAPPEFLRVILSRSFETSPMRQLANVLPMSAGEIELPLDTDNTALGGWVGEQQTRDVSASPTVGLQRVSANEQYAMPEVTQTLLDDAGFPIEDWLGRKIGGCLGRAEATAFVSGDGILKPKGFLTETLSADADASRAWGQLQVVDTGAAGGFPKQSGSTADDADSLIDVQMSLKPEFLPNAVWGMRRSTAGVVRKLKDSDGRWIWVDNLVDGGRPLLLGHAVHYLEDLPAIGSGSLSVVFGDFKAGYGIFDRLGVRLIRDNITRKGWVRFYTSVRVGGATRNYDALKILRFSA